MRKAIYAIGDIHGDLEQLLEAHMRVKADALCHGYKDYEIVHVGDLVDRREDSCGVIEYLMTGLENNEPWIVLKGNHDRLFYRFLDDPHQRDPVLRPDYTWLTPKMGGLDTLRSYGVYADENYDLETLHKEAVARVPAKHKAFLEALPLSYEAGDFLFVHAGIKPKVPLVEQTEDDLLWIRAPFHEYLAPHPKIIVHGHTSIDEVTHYGNRINIDTGAAWGNELSTIVIDANDAFLVGEDGRELLVPQD